MRDRAWGDAGIKKMRPSALHRGVYRPEHEKLQVYQHATKAVELVEQIARGMPATRPDLADQMRRSSTSVALNIAEGANEFSTADKAKFYRIARRSAGETLAALDVARI